jgi:hypothetical protein
MWMFWAMGFKISSTEKNRSWKLNSYRLETVLSPLTALRICDRPNYVKSPSTVYNWHKILLLITFAPVPTNSVTLKRRQYVSPKRRNILTFTLCWNPKDCPSKNKRYWNWNAVILGMYYEISSCPNRTVKSNAADLTIGAGTSPNATGNTLTADLKLVPKGSSGWVDNPLRLTA